MTAKDIDGSEEREIVIPRGNREPRRFKGEYYLKHFALPNFFFHATTLYALLRHNGVELGKMPTSCKPTERAEPAPGALAIGFRTGRARARRERAPRKAD